MADGGKDPCSHGHLWRLVSSDGGAHERWKCARPGCKEDRIDSLAMHCRNCGGFKHEPRPWWCSAVDQHET